MQKVPTWQDRVCQQSTYCLPVRTATHLLKQKPDPNCWVGQAPERAQLGCRHLQAEPCFVTGGQRGSVKPSPRFRSRRLKVVGGMIHQDTAAAHERESLGERCRRVFMEYTANCSFRGLLNTDCAPPKGVAFPVFYCHQA